MKENILAGFLPALGAAGLFFLFWMGLALPLTWSAAAGALAYGALWLVIRGMGGTQEETGINLEFVDKKLAEKVLAAGRQLLEEFRTVTFKFSKDRVLAKKLTELGQSLEAIIRDVELDPRDAPAASGFLGFQGQAALRLAKMAWDLEVKGSALPGSQDMHGKIEANIDRLSVLCKRQLEALQADNVSEFNAELEVLETSLGLDRDFDEVLEKAQKSAGSRGSKTSG